MIRFFKTIEGRVTQIEAVQKDCWVYVEAPAPAELEYLHTQLGVDSGFLSSATDEEEISHIEKEDDQTLVIVDMPVQEKQEQDSAMIYYTIPLSFVVLSECIVTITMQPAQVLEEIASGTVKNVNTAYKTNFVLKILLRMSTRYIQYLRQIDKITNLTEKQLNQSMRNKELIQLLSLEKSMVYFSTGLKSTETTLEKILRGRILKLYEADEDLLEDTLIEIKQAIETCNIYSGILSGTMDAYASIISNNLNIVMKVLTSITIVMAVPNVIFSFYGMNTSGLPFPFTWFAGGIAVAICALAAYLLYKKGYFKA